MNTPSIASRQTSPDPAPLTNFDLLIEDDPNTTADGLQPWELRFNDRLDVPANRAAALNPQFIAWYLGQARRFGDTFQLPMYVDQFGATVAATNGSQLRYEQDVIDFAEASGWHWSRWSYNLGSHDRTLVDNPVVRAFYQTNLAALLQRDHEPVIDRLTNDAVRLTWSGRVLQTSTNLGQWSDVPAAPSPLETNVSTAPRRFWRLRTR